MCAPWDTGCLAGEVATAAAAGIFGQVSQMVITAVSYMIDVSATWWVLVPSIKLYPNAANTSPDAAPIDAVARIRALMVPIAAIIATGGMLWNGLLMVLSRKPAPLVNVLRGLWNTALWSAVGVFGTNLLLYATDQFSAFVITSSLDSVGEPSFAKRLHSMVIPITGPTGGIPVGLVTLIAAIALICAFIQALLMLFRDGSVLILAASMPLAASGSFANATNGWLPKLIKWQLALIFYKPTASMVYATAIWMQGENRSSDPRVLLMGIAMMIVALVALPVLLRFFNWTIGGLQSGGGGFGMLAGAGAAGLHAASSLRGGGLGGGFGAGDHARYLSDMFDRGSSPEGPGPGGNDPGSRRGLGPGSGPGPGPGSGPRPGPGPGSAPAPGFKPPTFVGEAGPGKVSNITSAGGSPPGAGVPPGSGAASGSAGTGAAMKAAPAAGPAAPVVAGTVVVADTAAKTAKGAANAAANATSDATKDG